MNKYLINPMMRGMVQLKDDQTIKMIDYTRSDIDWIYEVPEDGILSIEDTEIQNREVKQDDLVVVFYKRDGQVHRAIVIDNTEWKENLQGVRKYAAEHPITNNNEAIGDIQTCATC